MQRKCHSFPGQVGGDILAQSAQDGDDTRWHGRAPSSTWVDLGGVLTDPPECPEFLSCSICDVMFIIQKLMYFSGFLATSPTAANA